MQNKFKNRYAIVFAFLLFYIFAGFLVRISLSIISAENISENWVQLFGVFFKGFLFDFSVALSFVMLHSIYLLLFPSRWIGSKIDPKNKTISKEAKLENATLEKLTISYYQTASERFKNKMMKTNNN